ncbi:MAG: cytidylate kinase-like family protein [Planctomycetes bacterium]|nr:cytidylate kinase-like family protein [Planctomycetota bacterium]
MSIVTISRGSYSKGKEIAEKLAQRLGYECISRDILLEASEHFNIPEVKLIRAIHDSPSVLERFTFGKETYIAFIHETFLEYIQKDNIVYHGLAGQFLAKGIPNILKVRITANIEDRVREEMRREDISEKEARYILKKDDEERRKWSQYIHGIDTKDSDLYDIVIHIDNITVDNAVNILCDVVKYPCFQTTPESHMILKDMLLAAKAYSALAQSYPKATVRSEGGVVFVSIEANLSLEAKVIKQVGDILKDIDGVKEIRTHVIPFGA